MSAEAGSGRTIRGLATVVGDLSSVASARLVVAVLSLGGSIATTHMLVPANYAVIAYMGVGATLLLVVGSGWTSAAVARYGREDLERISDMRRVVWARVAITAPILITAVVLFVALEAAGLLPSEFTWPFVSLTIAIGILGVACDQMIVALEAFGRMRAGARAGAARQVMLFVGLVTLLAASDGSQRSPLPIAWLMLAVGVVLTVALLWLLRRHRLWPPRLERAQVGRVLRFSLPLVAFSASQYVMSSIDIVVLRAFRPPAEVGTYALAYTGYATLQSLAASLTVVLIPLLVSLRLAGRSELITYAFQRLLPSAVLLFSIAGGLLAPIGALLVPAVFGAGFAGAGEPFAILVAPAVMLSIASCVAPILMLNERTGATGAISVAALIVNVVGDVLLVGLAGMGGDGPAIATTAAIAVTVCGYITVARRDLGVSPAVRPELFVPLAAGIVPTVLGSAPLGLACAATAAALVLIAASARSTPATPSLSPGSTSRHGFAGRSRGRSSASRAEAEYGLPLARDAIRRVLGDDVRAAARRQLGLVMAIQPGLARQLHEPRGRALRRPTQPTPANHLVRIVRQHECGHTPRPALEQHVGHAFGMRGAEDRHRALDQRRERIAALWSEQLNVRERRRLSRAQRARSLPSTRTGDHHPELRLRHARRRARPQPLVACSALIRPIHKKASGSAARGAAGSATERMTVHERRQRMRHSSAWRSVCTTIALAQRTPSRNKRGAMMPSLSKSGSKSSSEAVEYTNRRAAQRAGTPISR